jgi:hypothetical protein
MARVQTWMWQHRDEHRDPLTDEVNMTALAEDAAREFDMYDGDDPDERLFEWAYRVETRDAALRTGHISGAVGGLINSRGSDWF